MAGFFVRAAPLSKPSCCISPAYGRLRAESAYLPGSRAKPTSAKRSAKSAKATRMTKEQLKLLARMIRDGQAKIVESKGKLIPVSLI